MQPSNQLSYQENWKLLIAQAKKNAVLFRNLGKITNFLSWPRNSSHNFSIEQRDKCQACTILRITVSQYQLGEQHRPWSQSTWTAVE